MTPLSGVRFERGKNVFKDYIDNLFILKKHSSGCERVFAKLMLNCQYGR